MNIRVEELELEANQRIPDDMKELQINMLLNI